MLSLDEFEALKERLRRGQHAGGPKLDEARRLQLVRDFIAGASVRELMSRYGLSRGGVNYVLWSRAATAAKAYEPQR